MPDGQVEIAAAIVCKANPRIACLAPTGYGKSEAVSMGVILRTVLFHEPFIIGSVKYGTSEVIMKKVIAHIFDCDDFVRQLEIEENQSLTELKRERNKSNVNFKRGGGIRIVSLHGAELDVSKAIGEHAPNIILDESPLLAPAKYLQVLKILEGTGRYDKTFLFELGNALNRNHFMNNVLFKDDYLKINIGLDQAIAEGRLDQKSIDEKRGMPFFEQFYECKFPDEDAIDEKGYRQLLTTGELETALAESVSRNNEPMKLGVDIGAGGDFNVYVIRQGQNAWIEASNRSNDTMTNVNEIERIIEKYTVIESNEKKRLLKPESVFIDDIGIGRGVTDRCKEKGLNVNGVSVGEVPVDKTKYKNIKAENYWALGQWIKTGGKLLKRSEWQQLTWIKYKVSTDKVLQIEPKEDLKQRTGKSPDFAESLMLTFSTPAPEPNIRFL